MKDILYVIHKETGETRAIVAERFNPELHEHIEAPVVATPEETVAKPDYETWKLPLLKSAAKVRGFKTLGLKKKEIIKLLTQ